MATSKRESLKASTGQDSKNIGVESELAIAIALLARLEEKVEGVTVETANIYMDGQQVAIAIINGCVWQDGRLVLAKDAATDEPAA